MCTFASKVFRCRNLVEQGNNILVEWRELGKPAKNAVCGSTMSYQALIRKLKREGYVSANVWDAKLKMPKKPARAKTPRERLLLAFVQSIVDNQADALWQPQWFELRDRAKVLLQAVERI